MHQHIQHDDQNEADREAVDGILAQPLYAYGEIVHHLRIGNDQ